MQVRVNLLHRDLVVIYQVSAGLVDFRVVYPANISIAVGAVRSRYHPVHVVPLCNEADSAVCVPVSDIVLDAAHHGTPLGVHAVLVGQQLDMLLLKYHGPFGDSQVVHYPTGVLGLSHILQSELDAVGDFEHRTGGRMDTILHHSPIQSVEPIQQVVEGIVALHWNYLGNLAFAPVSRSERVLRRLVLAGV